MYADATARQMFQGKQLNRVVRGIKLVLEALSHDRETTLSQTCNTPSGSRTRTLPDTIDNLDSSGVIDRGT